MLYFISHLFRAPPPPPQSPHLLVVGLQREAAVGVEARRVREDALDDGREADLLQKTLDEDGVGVRHDDNVAERPLEVEKQVAHSGHQGERSDAGEQLVGPLAALVKVEEDGRHVARPPALLTVQTLDVLRQGVRGQVAHARVAVGVDERVIEVKRDEAAPPPPLHRHLVAKMGTDKKSYKR